MAKTAARFTARLVQPTPATHPFVTAGVQANLFYLTRHDPADGKYVVLVEAGAFRSLNAADIKVSTEPGWAGCTISKGLSVLRRPALYKLQDGVFHG